MRAYTLLLGIALLGCAPHFDDRDWTKLSATEREKALKSITSKCGLPANRARILSGDAVRVMPNSNDPYEAVDCMLRGLKTLRGIELGFVGNEAFSNKVN